MTDIESYPDYQTGKRLIASDTNTTDGMISRFHRRNMSSISKDFYQIAME